MHPAVDILVRTYSGDFCWLWLCLKQIVRNARGFRDTIIVVPEGDEAALSALTLERVCTCPRYSDDYIGQQITKMNADMYSDADLIMHMDADTMVLGPLSPSDLMDEYSRIIIYYEPYSAIDSPWQPVVEKALGWKPEHEFMRRHPFMYPRWLYKDVRRFIENLHGMDFEHYATSLGLREFSEFNVLGAYAWQFERDKFCWRHPSEGRTFVRQFWSWGGMDKIKEELEEIMR